LFENYCPGGFFISGEWEFAGFGNRFEDIRRRPCSEDIVTLGREGREDFDDLLVSFAWTVNYLRETLAKMAMVVNACEAEVLVW